jgi:hypothetical protein
MNEQIIQLILGYIQIINWKVTHFFFVQINFQIWEYTVLNQINFCFFMLGITHRKQNGSYEVCVHLMFISVTIQMFKVLNPDIFEMISNEDFERWEANGELPTDEKKPRQINDGDTI